MKPASSNGAHAVSQHIQDRVDARIEAKRTMEAMQARGEWDRAAEFHAEQIAPLNEWLAAHGVW